MVLVVIMTYLIVLLLFGRMATGQHATNETFFRGERKSPWQMVAFGMIGASVSGVTFVSVPGMVMRMDMTYLQTCLGFILGYFVVAFVLLPVYYRLNLTTIYTYLYKRMGKCSYKTGAAFFLLSKMMGTVVKFYLFCFVIQGMLAPPFSSINSHPSTSYLLPLILVPLVWLYSRRGGIKTLVWTDSLQTFCMLGALLLIIYKVMGELDFDFADAVQAVATHEHSRIFVFDDWASPQNFWKQFVSGIFIVVVMTGLDQDIMQKNLTCRTLREAQKDMCSYGFAFVPLNLLFMGLGILLLLLAGQRGMALPVKGDELLPMFAATGELGTMVQALFALGLVAASFSTADSAMTSITTSCCVDIFERPADEQLRHRVHLGVAAVMVLLIWVFGTLNSTSVIDAVYTLVSYTYGPLLGLFAFGLLTKKNVNDRAVPYIAIMSPLICLLLDKVCAQWIDYHFGYELLMLNGALTFLGLYLIKKKSFRGQH